MSAPNKVTSELKKKLLAFEGTHVDCWKKHKSEGLSLRTVSRIRREAGIKTDKWINDWPYEESDELIRLKRQGKGATEIAAIMGKPLKKVNAQIERLNLNAVPKPVVLSPQVASALAAWDRYFAAQDRTKCTK